MCKFIELRDEAGDKCLLNCNDIIAVYEKDDNRSSVYVRDGHYLDVVISYDQIKKSLGVDSDDKS